MLLESDKVPAFPLSGCFSRRIMLYKYNILVAHYLCLFQSDEGEVNQSKETGNDNPLQGDEAEASQCIENAPDGQTLGEPSMHASCYIEVCILCWFHSKE